MQQALELGQSKTVFVSARPQWNDTGIRLTQGATYSAIARGAWVDWTITCDADGYESGGNIMLRLTEWMRRAPAERWFALIGSIDQNPRTTFPIGRSRIITPSATGELTCFANDVMFAYWNNCGAVELTVTRTSGVPRNS